MSNPRHPLHRGLVDEPLIFIGQAGDLDIYEYDASLFPAKAYRVVCSMARAPAKTETESFNHTRFTIVDGAIRMNDTDVVPTPYEMCLIYQILEKET